MERLKRTREILEQLQLNAILVTSPYNMRYISGFAGGEGLLYITREKSILFTDSRYTIQARAESKTFTVVESASQSKTVEKLKVLFEEDKIESVGLEDEVLTYKEARSYMDISDKIHWVGLGTRLEELRIIKTEDELQKLEKAEGIGDAAFSHILTVIKPGITELEIAAELEYFMKKNGALKTSFDTIIASGIHSSMPHAIPTTKKIELGDFVTMDFGCMVDGYCSDMTRTIVVGKANEKQKEIYNVVLKAQLESLEAVKAGVKGSKVDAVARKIIGDAGYGDCFGHGLGHSVGLFIHENPRFSPTCDETIQANTIMTVEPGIYVDGFGGVRIEDMIVVTKDGYRNFAHSEKNLIEL